MQCRRSRFDLCVEKMPWRRAMKPTLVFLPGESHGQRSLAGYSPWGRKELDTTEYLSTIPPRVHRRTHQMPVGSGSTVAPGHLSGGRRQAYCPHHLRAGRPRTSLSCLAPPAGAPSLLQTGGGLVISSNPCPQGQEWGRPLFLAPFLQE